MLSENHPKFWILPLFDRDITDLVRAPKNGITKFRTIYFGAVMTSSKLRKPAENLKNRDFSEFLQFLNTLSRN